MTCIADFFLLSCYTLCASVLVICESLYCALIEVLADSVFYWELIFNRNNIFQKSNDIDFSSFQFISLKLARVTYIITYNRKYFSASHTRGPLHWLLAHNKQQETKK